MKISEKMLEDYVCSNLDVILPWISDLELIGRQIQLKHGRLDVLAFCGYLMPIELKVVPLQERHIGQLLRYVFDIEKDLVRASSVKFPKALTLRQTIFCDMWYEYHSGDGTSDSVSWPVLIGTKCDESILAAAQAADIRVILWTYEDGQYKFSSPNLYNLNIAPYDDPLPDWMVKVNWKISEYCRADTEAIFEQGLQKLFGIEV